MKKVECLTLSHGFNPYSSVTLCHLFNCALLPLAHPEGVVLLSNGNHYNYNT
jgi:hypothetical protein